MTSTLDADVQVLLADKDHVWVTSAESGGDVSQQYCARCARRRDDVKLSDSTYLPCKGFVG